MIVNKPTNIQEPITQPEVDNTPEVNNIPEEYRGNPIIGAYQAVKEMLFSIKENPNDPNSPPFFKTIKLDNGQLSRLKNNKYNLEGGIVMPAVFIHFIDVYYNVNSARIAEGKGTMRIHYILNRLNNSDDGIEGEEEGLVMFNRIIEVIESNKSSFPQLVKRFQLQYWDQPLTFDDALQPYWIDYQIWFNDYTAYKYRNYVDVYPIAPPLTQHSDQNEIANPDHLPNDKETRLEDVQKFG